MEFAEDHEGVGGMALPNSSPVSVTAISEVSSDDDEVHPPLPHLTPAVTLYHEELVLRRVAPAGL
jgi:hypothetical protein